MREVTRVICEQCDEPEEFYISQTDEKEILLYCDDLVAHKEFIREQLKNV